MFEDLGEGKFPPYIIYDPCSYFPIVLIYRIKRLAGKVTLHCNPDIVPQHAPQMRHS